ncbi:MAG: helix-turn-helix transcriptional regulator [Gemmataceae bacterium]|nr:helix-turn-helix transcriptional regulator [Gemmataceae bacterium]
MMQLARLIREAREARGLDAEQVAVRMGYRDILKGRRKIMTAEATGVVPEETLVRLAEVLDLDWCEVVGLLLPA